MLLLLLEGIGIIYSEFKVGSGFFVFSGRFCSRFRSERLFATRDADQDASRAQVLGRSRYAPVRFRNTGDCPISGRRVSRSLTGMRKRASSSRESCPSFFCIVSGFGLEKGGAALACLKIHVSVYGHADLVWGEGAAANKNSEKKKKQLGTRGSGRAVAMRPLATLQPRAGVLLPRVESCTRHW